MVHGDDPVYPKEQGCLDVDRQRPITLLTCKIKWLTGVLKLVLTDLVPYAVQSNRQDLLRGDKWKPTFGRRSASRNRRGRGGGLVEHLFCKGI